MKRALIVFLLFSLEALAQRSTTYVAKGNEYYLQLEFALAEDQYRKALEVEPRNAEARYNLGNALMQQKKYKAAIEEYGLLTTENKNLQAAAHYNTGVSYTKQKDLPASIEAYKAALRINSADKEARENLQKALSELKKEQNQQNNQSNAGGGGMSESQADKKLRELQEKEKELQQKKQQGQNKGTGGARDW